MITVQTVSTHDKDTRRLPFARQPPILSFGLSLKPTHQHNVTHYRAASIARKKLKDVRRVLTRPVMPSSTRVHTVNTFSTAGPLPRLGRLRSRSAPSRNHGPEEQVQSQVPALLPLPVRRLQARRRHRRPCVPTPPSHTRMLSHIQFRRSPSTGRARRLDEGAQRPRVLLRKLERGHGLDRPREPVCRGNPLLRARRSETRMQRGDLPLAHHPARAPRHQHARHDQYVLHRCAHTALTPTRAQLSSSGTRSILFAPIGIKKLCSPTGELVPAMVAGELGLPFCLSIAGSHPIEAIAAAKDAGGAAKNGRNGIWRDDGPSGMTGRAEGPRFFQLYMGHDDDIVRTASDERGRG
jgi:hypothetical protein